MYTLKSDRSYDGIINQNRALQLRIPAHALADLAEEDPRIVAGSSDLKFSTQLSEFEKRHPKRFFQFGICERNMVAAAAGMASCGLIPYVATFASFSGLMCLENLRTDLAYPSMRVRVFGTHAGIACGYFATSHHATEDISATRGIANLMVLSPCDGNSAAALIRNTLEREGPIYFRMGRGREDAVYDEVPESYGPGAPFWLRRGAHVAIAATGVTVGYALGAAVALQAKGIDVSVLDVHTLKPFDSDFFAEVARNHGAIISVEEHNIQGGLGSLIQESVSSRGLRTPVYKHGFYDEFCIIGPPTHLYTYYGLDSEGIAIVVDRVHALIRSNLFFDRDSGQPIWTNEDRQQAMERILGQRS